MGGSWEETPPWLERALCITIIIIVVIGSAVLLIKMVGYLKLPEEPGVLVTFVNSPNASLLRIEMVSVRIGKSTNVVVVVKNIDSEPHSGRVEAVAYNEILHGEVVAQKEQLFTAPPNKTVGVVLDMSQDPGKIKHVVVALDQLS